jgi:hypothetical protein
MIKLFRSDVYVMEFDDEVLEKYFGMLKEEKEQID